MAIIYRFFITLFVMFFVTITLAQDYRPYYDAINEGDWALNYKKDTIAFLENYEKAFSIVEPFLFDQLELACIYAIQKKWDKTAFYLEKALYKGYPLDGFKNIMRSKGANMREFEQTIQYQQLQQNKQIYFNHFLQQIDFEVYEQIAYLVNTDQYLSKEALAPTDSLWRNMRETVMLHNLDTLLGIIKQKGYPGEKLLGFRTTMTETILIHNAITPVAINDPAETSMLNYIVPTSKDSLIVKELNDYLKPLVMKGEITRGTYLTFVDNIVAFMAGFRQIQYYGERTNRATKTFFPIWDIKNVDKRREEIGLPPLYETAKKKGIPLPADYSIPEKYKNHDTDIVN